eukprot:SAG11_NODE_114_length_16040_cov_10.050875_13_plen_219_part_00
MQLFQTRLAFGLLCEGGANQADVGPRGVPERRPGLSINVAELIDAICDRCIYMHTLENGHAIRCCVEAQCYPATGVLATMMGAEVLDEPHDELIEEKQAWLLGCEAGDCVAELENGSPLVSMPTRAAYICGRMRFLGGVHTHRNTEESHAAVQHLRAVYHRDARPYVIPRWHTYASQTPRNRIRPCSIRGRYIIAHKIQRGITYCPPPPPPPRARRLT